MSEVHGKPGAAKGRLEGSYGCVVWLTGLSGAGKSTIGIELERELSLRGVRSYRLDGDVMRQGLCSDLGFSAADRRENIRRAAHVASLFADAGLICIAAFISPYRTERELARKLAGSGRFVETYLNTPLAICEKRDPKGLYAKARAGLIRDFTGISAPYEPPLEPELELRTAELTPAECVDLVLEKLLAIGCVRAADTGGAI